MRIVHTKAQLSELRHTWPRWAGIVERLAQKHGDRQGVTDREYEALHRSLIQACQALADAAEGPEKGFYQQLAHLAGPWLTVQSLGLADQEILAGLARQCREAGRQLGGCSSRPLDRGLVRSGIGLLLGAGTVLVLWWISRESGLGLGPLSSSWRLVRQSVPRWDLSATWVVSGALLALVAMIWAWQVKRH